MNEKSTKNEVGDGTLAQPAVGPYLEGEWSEYDVPYGDDEMHSLAHWMEKGALK